MKRLLSLILILLGGAFLVARPQPQLVSPVSVVKSDAKIFDYVNDYRAQNSLPPLIEDLRLDDSAKAKCADMQSKAYFSHNSAERSWKDFFPERTFTIIGENLAEDYYGKETVDAWVASPAHRDNLLKNYTLVGYASCDGIMGHLIVQHLALP